MEKIINSIVDIKYKKRMNDMFNMIFINYKHHNKNFWFLNSVTYEFVNLLIQTTGDFQIITDRVYLFKDKRFFIPMNHMLETEINEILNLINTNKVTLSKKYKNIKIFSTEPIPFKVSIKTRLNLLYGFLRFIAQMIVDFNIKNEPLLLLLQYKINLCKRFITISKILEYHYNLNLSRNINIFLGIIKGILKRNC